MSTISQKNQVTIPVAVLREAGLRAGDDVRIVAIAPGRLELARLHGMIAEFAGMLDVGVYPPGYVHEVRRGWR